MDERLAVAIVTSFDTTDPLYGEAVSVAFARRGTRDAVLVTLANSGAWKEALETFHGLRGSDAVRTAHIDAVYATAHYVAGSPTFASAICRRYPDNQMMKLLSAMIERDTPAATWVARFKGLQLDTCYAFTQ